MLPSALRRAKNLLTGGPDFAADRCGDDKEAHDMTRTVRCALSLVALVAVAAPASRAAGEPELDGVYMSEGLNPDGREYRGLVHIARHGESFVVSWMSARIGDDALLFVPTSIGVGIVNGGMLAVSYYSEEMAGIVLYRIEEDGHRLAGIWAVVGDDGGVYSETLTRLPAAGPPDPSVGEAPPRQERPARPVKPVLPRSGHVL
jgi:hypothetical protein